MGVYMKLLGLNAKSVTGPFNYHVPYIILVSSYAAEGSLGTLRLQSLGVIAIPAPSIAVMANLWHYRCCKTTIPNMPVAVWACWKL